MPAVAIAMTVHNGLPFLRMQLDSILAQHFTDFELAIADDGSTDGSQNELEKYAQSDHRIRIVRNEQHLGYVKNFERCIMQTTSEFVALCDQDDIWRYDKLKQLLGGIGNALVVHSDARVIDSVGREMASSFTSFLRKDVKNSSFEALLQSNIVTGCTCLIRRELFSLSRPFPSCIPHDWWLAIMAAERHGIAYCNLPLVSYRQHSSNLIGAISKATRKGQGRAREIQGNR